MDQDQAIAALAALAHSTRLNAFRLLAEHAPDGLPTGALVDASGLTQSSFSTHLAVLAKAELVVAERRGRQQIQRANLDRLRRLMAFLAMDCAQGRATFLNLLAGDLANDQGSLHHFAAGAKPLV